MILDSTILRMWIKMFNFIIYEDDMSATNLYKEIIHEFIGGKKDGYKIVSLNRYDNNLVEQIHNLMGKKIYILDVHVPGKNGLDFARDIRASGDWLSQIIIISEFEKYRKEAFTSKMLTLDFIAKDDDVTNCLKATLNLAYKITNTHKAYTFQYNGELYNIPYHDILYFEKDLNDNYSFVVTEKGSYKIKESITSIENKLKGDLRFFKTHRSCIINLHNVRLLELNTNTIYFIGNKETNLLSRNKKKELKEKLTNCSILTK